MQLQPGHHELAQGDLLLLGREQTLVLLGDDGAKYTVGEKSVVKLEKVFKKEKRLQLLLVKGSIRALSTQAGSAVRTFAVEVRCQPGLLDILADTGKSLVIPQRGAGAVLYSSYQVKQVLVQQKALVDQKGLITIQKTPTKSP